MSGETNGGVFNPKNLSLFTYTYNNPVNLVDPDGNEVYAVFNKTTEKLAIIDLDHIDRSKSFVRRNAKNYDFSGKTKNQILVVDNVFTGENRRGENTEKNRPIPDGNYEILDNDLSGKKSHSSWFRLDKIDDNLRDDWSSDGRGNYRLHPGENSWGCVTIDKSKDKKLESWGAVSKILNSTSTKTVDGHTRQKRRWDFLPDKVINSDMKKFGEIHVEK